MKEEKIKRKSLSNVEASSQLHLLAEKDKEKKGKNNQNAELSPVKLNICSSEN